MINIRVWDKDKKEYLHENYIDDLKWWQINGKDRDIKIGRN